MLLEVICQVALIDEASHRRYQRGSRATSEKLARSLDADLDEILMRRQPGRFPERANDSEGRHSRALCQCVERGLIGAGVRILEHLAYDTHDARLVPNREPPIQTLTACAPARVMTDQFRYRYADSFLSLSLMENAGGIRIGTSVSMAESIGCADYAVECLIRASNPWVTQDKSAKFRRLTIRYARGLRVQDRQFDWEVDREIGQRLHARARAARVHFARRYHHDIALAREALRSPTPKRASSAEDQSKRIGVVAVPSEALRLVSGAQHFNRLPES